MRSRELYHIQTTPPGDGGLGGPPAEPIVHSLKSYIRFSIGFEWFEWVTSPVSRNLREHPGGWRGTRGVPPLNYLSAYFYPLRVMGVRRGRITKTGRYGRLAGYAGRLILRGAQNYLNKYSAPNIATSRVQRSSVDMAPLTGERDVRVTYRKRRMNRRKRRRYVKSLKRWRTQNMRSEGSNIFKCNYVATEAANANCSVYFGALVGLCAQSAYDTHIGDCYDKMINGGTAQNRAQSTGVRVDHMSITVVLRNISASVPAMVDIDVYKVICIRDIPMGASPQWPSGLTIESWLTVQKNQMRTVGGMVEPVTDAGVGVATAAQNAGASSATQAVGDLLFDNPPALRYWKVLKVWKIHLPPGGTANFGHRVSKNYYIKKEDCFLNGLAAKKGVTQGYIFNMNGRWDPGAEAYAPVDVIQEQFVRYNMKGCRGTADTLTFDGV